VASDFEQGGRQEALRHLETNKGRPRRFRDGADRDGAPRGICDSPSRAMSPKSKLRWQVAQKR
jgi:hypothetical protein